MVRLKNRYIVVEINPKNLIENSENPTPLKLHQHALNQSIQSKIQQLHGDFGVAAIRSGFHAKYTNELTRIAIIRCRQGPHKLVTSVIPFITNIDSHSVSVNILYVGATIRQCFTFIKLYQERKCDELCARLDSDEAKESYRNTLLNFESILKALQN